MECIITRRKEQGSLLQAKELAESVSQTRRYITGSVRVDGGVDTVVAVLDMVDGGVKSRGRAEEEQKCKRKRPL